MISAVRVVLEFRFTWRVLGCLDKGTALKAVVNWS
jgi:hypothetical protein